MESIPFLHELVDGVGDVVGLVSLTGSEEGVDFVDEDYAGFEFAGEGEEGFYVLIKGR